MKKAASEGEQHPCGVKKTCTGNTRFDSTCAQRARQAAARGGAGREGERGVGGGGGGSTAPDSPPASPPAPAPAPAPRVGPPRRAQAPARGLWENGRAGGGARGGTRWRLAAQRPSCGAMHASASRSAPRGSSRVGAPATAHAATTTCAALVTRNPSSARHPKALELAGGGGGAGRGARRGAGRALGARRVECGGVPRWTRHEEKHKKGGDDARCAKRIHPGDASRTSTTSFSVRCTSTAYLRPKTPRLSARDPPRHPRGRGARGRHARPPELALLLLRLLPAAARRRARAVAGGGGGGRREARPHGEDPRERVALALALALARGGVMRL